MYQEYTSKETSINTINAVYKKGYFTEGDEILDYGGGKYNSNVEYLARMGIKCFVFDPFNRSLEHNRAVLDYFNANKGANNIVCSNVICVIKEDEVIYNILMNIKGLLNKKTGSKIYIVVYEGNKSGIGMQTKKGYQRNQKAVEYTTYINNVFGSLASIHRKGNIFEIICK